MLKANIEAIVCPLSAPLAAAASTSGMTDPSKRCDGDGGVWSIVTSSSRRVLDGSDQPAADNLAHRLHIPGA
jgi:hypothetical protein